MFCSDTTSSNISMKEVELEASRAGIIKGGWMHQPPMSLKKHHGALTRREWNKTSPIQPEPDLGLNADSNAQLKILRNDTWNLATAMTSRMSMTPIVFLC